MRPQLWRIISDSAISVIGVVTAAVGVILWLSHIAFVTEGTAKAIEVVTIKQDKYSEDISEIKSDIRVIKQILKEGE